MAVWGEGGERGSGMERQGDCCPIGCSPFSLMMLVMMLVTRLHGGVVVLGWCAFGVVAACMYVGIGMHGCLSVRGWL